MKYCFLYQEGNGEERIVTLQVFPDKESMNEAKENWDFTNIHIHYFGELDNINIPI